MDGASILERLGSRRNILLLQGPNGPFFDRLARFLTGQGRTVTKINLNAGDRWFYRLPGALDFTDSPDRWPHFIDDVLRERGIEAVVLFGDCRPYHRSAVLRARLQSVPVFVFEEGYIRPNYVTFEPGGVNANSPLPRSPGILGLFPRPAAVKKERRSYWRMARYSLTYYLAGRIGRERFPNYRHHRPFDLFPEGWYWLRSGLRKLLYKLTERAYPARLAGELKGRYFLVALQVFNDSQIKHHSDYRSVRAMIAAVLRSFAREAPSDAHLVFKHHPMDRGHRHYGRQIAQAAAEAGMADRIHYVHDLHLPRLLQDARGVVVVNSTVGLSALYHHAPVKTLGRCMYDLPGLTHQGSLASFWNAPVRPDEDKHERFRSYLIAMTQVSGSFYSGEAVLARRLQRVAASPALPQESEAPAPADRPAIHPVRLQPGRLQADREQTERPTPARADLAA